MSYDCSAENTRWLFNPYAMRLFMFIHPLILSLCASFLFLGLSMVEGSHAWGQDMSAQSEQSSSGFSIPESIKGFDEEKVKNDPVCDSSVRPQILRVEPDEMTSGDIVVVEGREFGKKKECLHSVSFGSAQAKTFTFLNNERIEAIVPEGVQPGLTFLNITTGGGTARKGVLIK